MACRCAYTSVWKLDHCRPGNWRTIIRIAGPASLIGSSPIAPHDDKSGRPTRSMADRRTSSPILGPNQSGNLRLNPVIHRLSPTLPQRRGKRRRSSSQRQGPRKCSRVSPSPQLQGPGEPVEVSPPPQLQGPGEPVEVSPPPQLQEPGEPVEVSPPPQLQGSGEPVEVSPGEYRPLGDQPEPEWARDFRLYLEWRNQWYSCWWNRTTAPPGNVVNEDRHRYRYSFYFPRNE
ncbi:histone-lysine N-methyltransferase 2D-like isoform X2 [Clinocottus analis]|uniref:histone-lysine N-methyltransferase 2D-like isoform X2 n=1 Tax=Clinocottus analis TaxID=304258 RepID=UPI0035C23611